jgi:hypothetical protein
MIPFRAFLFRASQHKGKTPISVPEIMPAGAIIPEEEVIETTDQGQDQGTPEQGTNGREAAHPREVQEPG